MDVSQAVPRPVEDARPLDLSPLYNARCTENFDGSGNAYPAGVWPGVGRHRLGPHQVPFNLPANQSNQPDNIIAAGQHLPLPAGLGGKTLYLLAACANGSHWTDIGFQSAHGKIETRAFDLNDWEVNTYPDNAVGLTYPYRITPGGHDPEPPRMWIVHVPVPRNATALILPEDARTHLFAATIATPPQAAVRYGLSVLNDCKYGFDVLSNVFRLTALRSSSHPDPRPDQGVQQFTYSLFPHAGGWRNAHTDEQALALNIPLLARVTTPHPAATGVPTLSVTNIGGSGDLIVTALKHAEDGRGFILRFYEADGRNTRAQINFDQPMRVEETDLLERPLAKQSLTVQGDEVRLPVGHNQIVTLRFEPAGGQHS